MEKRTAEVKAAEKREIDDFIDSENEIKRLKQAKRDKRKRTQIQLPTEAECVEHDRKIKALQTNGKGNPPVVKPGPVKTKKSTNYADVPLVFARMPPVFIMTRKRMAERERVIKTYENPRGDILTIEGYELSVYDFSAYLSVRNLIKTGRAAKDKGGYYLISPNALLSVLGQKAGSEAYDRLWRQFARLAKTEITLDCPTTSGLSIGHLISGFSAPTDGGRKKGKKLEFYIDEKFLAKLGPLFIDLNLDVDMKLKGQASRILHWYLQGIQPMKNNQHAIGLVKLCGYLKLNCDGPQKRKARATIKESIKELVRVGYLSEGFIAKNDNVLFRRFARKQVENNKTNTATK